MVPTRLDDVAEIRGLVGLQLAPALKLGASGELTVDVNDGVAEHADGVQAAFRIGVDRRSEVLSDRHGHLDGSKLALRDDLNAFYVTDGDAFQVHRRAKLESR